jgi:hypothetical protein
MEAVLCSSVAAELTPARETWSPVRRTAEGEYDIGDALETLREGADIPRPVFRR